MAFTKQHYEMLADWLKEVRVTDYQLAKLVAILKIDNPRFDEERFFKAVGIEPHYWTFRKPMDSPHTESEG